MKILLERYFIKEQILLINYHIILFFPTRFSIKTSENGVKEKMMCSQKREEELWQESILTISKCLRSCKIILHDADKKRLEHIT